MSPSIPMPLRAAAGLAAAAIDEARRLPDRLVGLPVLAVSTAMQVSLKAQQRYAELVARGDQLLEELRGQQDGTPDWARFDDEEPFDAAAHDGPPGGEPEAGAAGAPEGADPAEGAGAAETHAAGTGTEAAATGPAEARAGDTGATAARTSGMRLGSAGAVTRPIEAEARAPGAGAGRPRAGARGAAETGLPRAEEEIAALSADPAPYDGYLSAELPLPNYDQLTLPQLRGKLRTLSAAQLAELVEYERGSGQRTAFLTMLENRIATLRDR